MSRHRFVKNIDLDGKCIVRITFYLPGPDTSLAQQRRWPRTQKKKECPKRMPVRVHVTSFKEGSLKFPLSCYPAALALSFSVAKPLLADLQPPIPDDSIRESLWHYFFDVDKAVTYLRKERQKG